MTLHDFGITLVVLGVIVGVGGPFLSGGKGLGPSFNWYVWGFLTVVAGAALVYFTRGGTT